jgi:hypothetical protein
VYDFKFKNMFRIAKTWAFKFTKGVFFLNEVLKSKIAREVKQKGPVIHVKLGDPVEISTGAGGQICHPPPQYIPSY